MVVRVYIRPQSFDRDKIVVLDRDVVRNFYLPGWYLNKDPCFFFILFFFFLPVTCE